MKARFATLLIVLTATLSFADDPVDRSGGWDVDAPLGPTRHELAYTASEGTWMNLDVHPDGESIIFDLLGDLYIVPISGGNATQLTSGAAYDFQARFSPDGGQILFTSDRGGIFTVWLADFDGTELSEFRNLNDGASNTWGGANWTADGDYILAKKRVTDVSSIGISEMWLLHKDGGSGVMLVSPKAEVDSFHGSADGRYIYFGSAGPFSYGRSPYGQIWSINRFDRETGEQRPVSQGPGSSASPVLSPDGATLAFVRRVDTESTLWLHDIATGGERQIWDGLDRDQIEGFGTHHIYPNFDWTPDGSALIVWAGGGFVRVPVDGSPVIDIPFEAPVALTWHEPLRFETDPAPDSLSAKLIRWPVISPDGESMVFNALGHIYWMRLPDGTPERVTDLDELEFSPTFSPDGRRVAFTTWSDTDGGALHEVTWRGNGPGNVRTIYSSGAQLVNPAYSSDGERLLVVAGSGVSLRGQDLGGEQRHDILVMDADGRGEVDTVTSTANRGTGRRITRPSFSGDGERIWYFDNEGGGGERGARTPPNTAVTSVKLDGTDKRIHMKFRYAQDAVVSPDESMVAFTELHNAYVVALPKAGQPVDFNPGGAVVAFEQFSQDGGEWVTWSHDGERLTWSFANVVQSLPVDEISLSGKAEPRSQGDDGVMVLQVSIDNRGNYAYGGTTANLDALKPMLERAWDDATQVRLDVTVADGATLKSWTDLESWAGEAKVGIIRVQDDSDEEEDAGEESSARAEYEITLEVPRAKPSGTFALTGGRIITMNGDEVIENGTVVVTDNRITAVGSTAAMTLPNDIQFFDVSGKTVMPGLIDVHAHMGYGVLDVNPQKEWRYYANLAYGVTTTHDPSASTHTVFSQAEMVEAGVMTGPRIFSTGFILYGATNADMAVINSYADALSHVRRMKSLGAISVKSYMQPKRSQRQWVIRAAASENMLVMPEGGGDFPQNIGMLMDGHSGIEHSLSVGEIYEDVIRLFATTRSGYTGTLLVAYGGQEGEKYFYQHDDVWKNEKLQSFLPPRQLDARARRRIMSDEDDFNHMLVAEGQKQVFDAGGLVTMGAHGQLQGLGAHWELWAISQGGFENHESLNIATLAGAEYLGMDRHIGSIEPGKLADIIVLDENPLDDIRNTEHVDMTIVNGVVFDADSMDELWPTPRERGRFHFQR